jgi:hypothetical protein
MEGSGAGSGASSAPATPSTASQYAVFKVVDHEGAKAWLPVGVEETGDRKGEPKGYPGKTRREAIKAAIGAGDAELGGGPYYAVPVSKIGDSENPKPPPQPAVTW